MRRATGAGSGVSTSFLEANLNALGPHNTRLAQRLRSTSPGPHCAFAPGGQGVPSLSWRGTQLCSRHKPLDEADRFVAGIDVIEHAAIVILGFAAGYHVQRLAQRLHKSSLIIVYEPDLALLRFVFERVDHSKWIAETNLVIVDDHDDSAEMAVQLAGAEGIVAQGATIAMHLPSRARLGDGAACFSAAFANLVKSMRTTMLTTLVHAGTTCRNLCLNLDHYTAGEGIAPLRNVAPGRTALLISAGPSLSRHYDLLADPSLRERVVLIAVQTCLRPLLRRGIRPHFVTALDYHEISRQFYDDLRPEDLRDITLICEPKVNRIVVESYPGPVRCVGNGFLDRLLGPLKRDMGTVPAGSTVAHLSFYFAQYLGCDPIVLLGQDLGFTDCLYYGPGAAIHDQWAPELNAFNTIDMMEWSRVARMKRHLRQAAAQDGTPMLIDEQMATYLSQFERDFSTAPQTIIDAAGGGVAKRHTVVRPLEEVLAELAATQAAPTPLLSSTRQSLDPRRLTAAMRQIESVRDEVRRLQETSENTSGIIEEMLEQQRNPPAMNRLFEKIKSSQREVARLYRAQDIVNLVNQLGAFKRLKADRRLELIDSLSPLERQREELLRDRTNLQWLAEACHETQEILVEAMAVLRGETVSSRISQRRAGIAVESGLSEEHAQETRPRRIAALIACDPDRNGLLQPRALNAPLGDSTVLQTTLQRLGQSTRLDSIVLIVPPGFDVRPLIDETLIGRPVIVRSATGPIYDEAQRAIAVARQWCDWSWRGGLGGMTIFDEIIAPRHMAPLMEEMQLDAAVIVGPDWPLVDAGEETGCDALIARYLEHPQGHRLVFSQAPPGMCGILIERSLMVEMASRARQFTLGSMLSYIPSLPQIDPISKDACIKLPSSVRNHIGRFTADTPARVAALHDFLGEITAELPDCSSADLITRTSLDSLDTDILLQLPQQVEIELTTRRDTRPFWLDASLPDVDLTLHEAKCVINQCTARPDVAITFGGRGDPLLHPHCFEIIRYARQQGCRAIHLRTDLPDAFGEATALLDLPIDVISIEVQGESAGTYRAIMGADRFDQVRAQVDALINHRTERSGDPNALCLPWIAPRLCRCRPSLEELRNFFDRWLHYAGAAIIDSIPACSAAADEVIRVEPPLAASRFMAARTLQIHADGAVFAGCSTWGYDASGETVRLGSRSLAEVWPRLREALIAAPPMPEEEPTLVLEFDAA